MSDRDLLRDCALILNGMAAGSLPACFKPNEEFMNRLNKAAHAEPVSPELRAIEERAAKDAGYRELSFSRDLVAFQGLGYLRALREIGSLPAEHHEGVDRLLAEYDRLTAELDQSWGAKQ